MNAAVDKTAVTFGRIDILVNNAGTGIPKKFEDTTLQEMDQMINLNLRGDVRRDPGRAETHEGRRPHHHDRVMRRRADDDAGLGGVLGHEGRD